MADPIPVNSRRDRIPPPARPAPPPLGGNPFGNAPGAPNPFGARPPFAAAANNPPFAPPPRPLAPPPPVELAPLRPPPPRQAAPVAADGLIFERRQRHDNRRAPRREGGDHRGERVMHMLVGIVLITVVLLSQAGQRDQSIVIAYEPRAGAVQAAPAQAEVAVRELVRACPSASCMALPSPTILEVGTTVQAIGVDPARAWVQVSGTGWQGWLPRTSLLGDFATLPVVN